MVTPLVPPGGRGGGGGSSGGGGGCRCSSGKKRSPRQRSSPRASALCFLAPFLLAFLAIVGAYAFLLAVELEGGEGGTSSSSSSAFSSSSSSLRRQGSKPPDEDATHDGRRNIVIPPHPPLPPNIPPSLPPHHVRLYRYGLPATYSGPIPQGCDPSHESVFLGIFTACSMMGGFASTSCHKTRSSSVEVPKTEFPPLGDHLFEWLDTIAALEHGAGEKRGGGDDGKKGGGGRFHMLELGAGWGKWIVDGAALASKLGIPDSNVRCVGLEAQDLHCKWAESHIRRNGFDESSSPGDDGGGVADDKKPRRVRMICGAASSSDGVIEFPKVSDRSHLKMRYGIGAQMLLDGKRNEVEDVVKVQSYGVCTLLNLPDFKGETIDFMSLDVQSYEHAVLEPTPQTLRCLDDKLKVLHVSLHRVEENDARQIANSMIGVLGWDLVRYFPLESTVDTEFGKVKFGDGLMTFVNPKLAPGLAESMRHPKNVHEGPYTQFGGKKMRESKAEDWSPGDYVTDIEKGTGAARR